MQVSKLSPEDEVRARRVGAEVAESRLAELEAKGLPARQVHKLMKSIADRRASSN